MKLFKDNQHKIGLTKGGGGFHISFHFGWIFLVQCSKYADCFINIVSTQGELLYTMLNKEIQNCLSEMSNSQASITDMQL